MCNTATIGENDVGGIFFGCWNERSSTNVYDERVKEQYITGHVQKDQCIDEGMGNRENSAQKLTIVVKQKNFTLDSWYDTIETR